MPPAVNVGDVVNFVNAGRVLTAAVQKVHDDGSLDLRYQDNAVHAAPVTATNIPFAPSGASHGWQPLVDAAPDPGPEPQAPAEAESAEGAPDA